MAFSAKPDYQGIIHNISPFLTLRKATCAVKNKESERIVVWKTFR